MAKPDPFDIAVTSLLEEEGGFVDHPDDPGGPTNFGISLRFLASLPPNDDGSLAGDLDRDGDVDAADIAALPDNGARYLYREQFWDRYDYQRLPFMLATKMLSLAVVAGPRGAHRMLQRALRATGDRVAEDGIVGPKTLAAVKQAPAAQLLAAFRSEAAGHFRALNAKRPDATAAFIDGWLNRAYR